MVLRNIQHKKLLDRKKELAVKELDRRIIRMIELLPPKHFSSGDKARLLLTLCGEKQVTLCGDYLKTDYKIPLSLIKETGLLTAVEPSSPDKERISIFCSLSADYLRQIVMAFRSGDDEAKGILFGYPRTAAEAFSKGLHGGRFELYDQPYMVQYCAIRDFVPSFLYWEREMEVVRRWCKIIKELSQFIWQQCLRTQAAIINEEDLEDGMREVKAICSQCLNNQALK